MGHCQLLILLFANTHVIPAPSFYYVELSHLTKVILVLCNHFNEVQFFVNSIEVHRLHGSTAHIGVDD